jgi:hypothetical protein
LQRLRPEQRRRADGGHALDTRPFELMLLTIDGDCVLDTHPPHPQACLD